jgi:hypothetical protein
MSGLSSVILAVRLADLTDAWRSCRCASWRWSTAAAGRCGTWWRGCAAGTAARIPPWSRWSAIPLVRMPP